MTRQRTRADRLNPEERAWLKSVLHDGHTTDREIQARLNCGKGTVTRWRRGETGEPRFRDPKHIRLCVADGCREPIEGNRIRCAMHQIPLYQHPVPLSRLMAGR